MNSGDIVYLTRHYTEWIKMLSSDIEVALDHRIAKIIKVFDWDTEEGKLLLDQRVKTGKWDNLNSEDFKYVLNVYYPELLSKDGKTAGITAIEVLPLYFPGTEFKLFERYPEHLIKDLKSNITEDLFRLERKKS